LSTLCTVIEELEEKIRGLYDIVCQLEEEKYDWEMKIRRTEFEVCY